MLRASRACSRARTHRAPSGSLVACPLCLRAVEQVRAGYYQVYYSPRVFTERPEQVTITLAVEVTGYDMGARFKGFAPDAARPCVRVQMPEVRLRCKTPRCRTALA